MTAPIVIAVDIGTSSVKAGAYGADGRALALASMPVRLDRSVEGAVTQDLDALHEASASAVRSLTGDLEGVAAIAFSGQMAGVGFVDDGHRPVGAYDSWLDIRCAPEIDRLPADVASQVLRTSGCAPTVSIGPKVAWWARHDSALTNRARRFVTAAGYVAGRAAGLRGEDAFIDQTYLHFTAVADTARGIWDPGLCQALGVPEQLLPRIVKSTSVIGGLSSSEAAAFGLDVGLPVVAGCGDTAAAAVGTGTLADGQAFDIAGTAAVMGLRTPRFRPDPTGTLLSMRSPLDDGAYSLAYVGGAGELVEWICVHVLGHESANAEAYSALEDALASTPAGAMGLFASPHFSGRVCPASPRLRGAVLGLTPAHTRAHIARAVLEAVAHEYRTYVDVAHAATGDALTSVVGVGGGAALLEWNQIKADVLGVRYVPLVGVDAGTRGTALVALAAIGAPVPHIRAAETGTSSIPNPVAVATHHHAHRRHEAWMATLVDGFNSTQN